MSGFRKYTFKVVDIETGEFREQSSPVTSMKFWQNFIALVKFFVYGCDNHCSLRIDINVTN